MTNPYLSGKPPFQVKARCHEVAPEDHFLHDWSENEGQNYTIPAALGSQCLVAAESDPVDDGTG
jgi:hypothetical protein